MDYTAIAMAGSRVNTSPKYAAASVNAAVVGVHARAVCIEDSRHLDAQLVLAVVIEEQSFRTARAHSRSVGRWGSRGPNSLLFAGEPWGLHISRTWRLAGSWPSRVWRDPAC